MRVVFTQSGGFAGAVKGCLIDTEALDPEARREVEELVAASGLAASVERFSATGRDLRQYEITLERPEGVARFVCDEDCVPAAARPLVAFLAARATPQRPGTGGPHR
jgi:hypothetical protein